MNNLRTLCVVSVVVLLTSVSAHAQATRTWVSGVGDDANPCSRTAPCHTFAGAISKTAAGGEIDILDPGGFGSLTITKSITVDGMAGLGGILNSSGANGITINAGVGDVVTLRNLSINGSGTGGIGVRIIQAKTVHIERSVISGNTGNGIDVNTNAALELTVTNSTVRDNGGSGISLLGTVASVNATIVDSYIQNNGASGLLCGAFCKSLVRNSSSSDNSGAGFVADATTSAAALNIADATSADNGGAGVQAIGGASTIATIRISNVSIASNGSAFSTSTNGNIYSYFNNHATGAGTVTSIVPVQ
ncbi:right-handed parallel beta-helix repeat-containing protein [Terriglobus saanensis]|uniref:Right handed beta helix domain-containing protein n=1 Tax=Terriglobus saanensis (strain ATCC BAA-1853 / DSM 23119 / SP1PR4) TaxID=401053 RepID=E8UZW1_TERSS|nr:right-handed parallel beta-helix repeat-containing protein [Terriglobus saanensis]ADV81038.1 hypothetical protein AciPR4_0200 [Terriglobus saanensis SP1PR4]